MDFAVLFNADSSCFFVIKLKKNVSCLCVFAVVKIIRTGVRQEDFAAVHP